MLHQHIAYCNDLKGTTQESDAGLYRPALETLRTLIRTSTSSMTSVPKPLKFLHPHYPELQGLYDTWPRSEDKSLFADILSVLAMTYSDTQPRGTLRYRLLAAQLVPEGSTSLSDPGSWGHEYVRHLAAELSEEYTFREQEEQLEMKTTVGSVDDLKLLATQSATFLLGHNAEPDAVDLLQELEIADALVDLVDENTYTRVCLYIIRYVWSFRLSCTLYSSDLSRCVNFLPPPDDVSFLETAHKIYVKHKRWPEAIALAIRLGRPAMIREDFDSPGNPYVPHTLRVSFAIL